MMKGLKALAAMVMVLMMICTMCPAFAKADAIDQYPEVVDVYRRIMYEHWDLLNDDHSELWFEPCYMLSYFNGAMYSADVEIGYAICDVDGNGIDDLMIMSSDGTVFDLFTCGDGSIGHVFSSVERGIYTYIGNGLFYRFESGGADDYRETTYQYREWDMIDLGYASDPDSWVVPSSYRPL